MTPLLSIIIPTADRQDYAAKAISAAAAACPEAEIVVSDTSASEGLMALLPRHVAARVRYIRPGVGLDVVSNFNAAAEAATGRWLTFLGDDDCVGPRIADIAGWAEGAGLDAVISYGSAFAAIYYWPGVTSRYFSDGYANKLIINRFSGRARPLDAKAAVRAALDDLGSGLGWMARAYHGLVSRRLVQEIIGRHAALFGGVSPDIYSATLISMMSRKSAVVDWPFILPGASPKSTAGLGAAQTDRSTLWTNPHIAPFQNLVWDPLIPEFYSPTTVWSYSFKKAVDAVNDPSLRPNLARLYARCLFHNRHFADATFQSVAAWGGSGVTVARARVLAELAGEGGRFALKVGKRLLAPRAEGAAVHTEAGLQDVEAAYFALDAWLKANSQLVLE